MCITVHLLKRTTEFCLRTCTLVCESELCNLNGRFIQRCYLLPYAGRCPAKESLISPAECGSYPPAKGQCLWGSTERSESSAQLCKVRDIRQTLCANMQGRAYCRGLTGLCSWLWCTGLSGNRLAAAGDTVLIDISYIILLAFVFSKINGLLWGHTAGVLLANVFRSLMLVLMSRRVLLTCELMLWFAARAMRTPTLKNTCRIN